MLDKEIEASEQREIKDEYEKEIEKLERKIEELTTLDSDLKEQISFLLRVFSESSEILYRSGFDSQTTNPGFDTWGKVGF